MMFEKTAIYDYELPGIGERFADPLAIRRRLLLASKGRCWQWAKQAKEFEKQLTGIGEQVGETADAQRAEWSSQQAELEGHLAESAFKAFELPPVDPDEGYGITEATALVILYDFLGWLEGKGEPSGS